MKKRRRERTAKTKLPNERKYGSRREGRGIRGKKYREEKKERRKREPQARILIF